MSDVLAVLRQPRWIAMLIALPCLMCLSLVAAKWQYGRHETRSAEEQRLTAATAAAPVPLATVLGPREELPAANRYTSVTVSGVYDRQSILIRNRKSGDAPALWVVTPLRSADGTAILVLRGAIEASRMTNENPVAPPPPAGEVRVTGVLQPSEAKRGPGILSNGEATSLHTATLCPEDTCYFAYLQAQSSQPPDSLEVVPVQGPGLGPHLGYAGQWLILFLLLPIGFVILLRREVQELRVQQDSASRPG
ncbi:MAG TPA: SURF1 family protein [Actinomycetota bacterium]|nr:SURF1 family protein [Actinomycetota bacterium]